MKIRVVIVAILLFPPWTLCAGFAAGSINQGKDTMYRKTHSVPNLRLVSQEYRMDELSCPLLPGCPSGPGVPLPPQPASKQEKTGPQTSENTGKLSEGRGKYLGMILIPAGPFEMGSADGSGRPDEKPLHKVYLADFYISKYEVTNAEFCKFLNKQGEMSSDGLPCIRIDDPLAPITRVSGVFQPKPGFADRPVTDVSWYGASDYARWAGGRLPTSAEWEKAALLTTTNPEPDNISLSSDEQSSPVFTAKAGAFGVAGMTGNVWEWCSDWYSRNYYAVSPAQNPLGPSLGQEKVIRGGSWASAVCSRRIQNIHKAVPRGYYQTVGFRIVKD
ncbi:MAG: formylglycine-generating enzyme family protein [Desulfomonilaceae bacterium]